MAWKVCSLNAGLAIMQHVHKANAARPISDSKTPIIFRSCNPLKLCMQNLCSIFIDVWTLPEIAEMKEIAASEFTGTLLLFRELPTETGANLQSWPNCICRRSKVGCSSSSRLNLSIACASENTLDENNNWIPLTITKGSWILLQSRKQKSISSNEFVLGWKARVLNFSLWENKRSVK